ncbi:MAG: hypothetical protein RLZZ383_516 [Pseudomonadota bacterium]
MSVFHHGRKWVYPLSIGGRFTKVHNATSVGLFAFLFVVPFLRLGGRPLFLFDIAARELTFLGARFTATEGVLIMLTALGAAGALFLVTAMFGRVWCGYACPQSVFMINVVFRIESWLEGDRSTRMAAEREPMTAKRRVKALLKYTLFLAWAWLVSMAFMGFFVPTDRLWALDLSTTEVGVVGFFTLLWFLDFTWFREQTCNYICPYARFQSALTDRHSWTIRYDEARGEPRGKGARARGGCIDCNKCVAVCPQGIDIRDGFQLECIACGKCIDACQTVMPKLGHPTLVRYTTMAKDAGEPTRLVRVRTVAYAGLLSAVLGGYVAVAGLHTPVELIVDRLPGALFVEDADGYVRNTYFVQVTDRTLTEAEGVWAVAIEGLPDGAQVQAQPLIVASGSSSRVPVIVRIPKAAAPGELPLVVRVRSATEAVTAETTFHGPKGQGMP